MVQGLGEDPRRGRAREDPRQVAGVGHAGGHPPPDGAPDAGRPGGGRRHRRGVRGPAVRVVRRLLAGEPGPEPLHGVHPVQHVRLRQDRQRVRRRRQEAGALGGEGRPPLGGRAVEGRGGPGGHDEQAQPQDAQEHPERLREAGHARVPAGGPRQHGRENQGEGHQDHRRPVHGARGVRPVQVHARRAHRLRDRHGGCVASPTRGRSQHLEAAPSMWGQPPAPEATRVARPNAQVWTAGQPSLRRNLVARRACLAATRESHNDCMEGG
mmetsp:Transcript_100275/g.284012  ORF Transcript_100275/g.284012 Transcript_100275/m.284012 type:complete len:268 (-) Transcript_100275:30-833(-)